jgi:hypothetical protein
MSPFHLAATLRKYVAACDIIFSDDFFRAARDELLVGRRSAVPKGDYKSGIIPGSTESRPTKATSDL